MNEDGFQLDSDDVATAKAAFATTIKSACEQIAKVDDDRLMSSFQLFDDYSVGTDILVIGPNGHTGVTVRISLFETEVDEDE